MDKIIVNHLKAYMRHTSNFKKAIAFASENLYKASAIC